MLSTLKSTLRPFSSLTIRRRLPVKCGVASVHIDVQSGVVPRHAIRISPRTSSSLIYIQNPLRTTVRRYSPDLPDHTDVPLPALSPTMEKGNIVSWKKKEGDSLAEGDVLCEIETDKAVMAYETPEEGYLAKIVLANGTKNVPVGKLLCVIVPEEGDVSAFSKFEAPQ